MATSARKFASSSVRFAEHKADQEGQHRDPAASGTLTI